MENQEFMFAQTVNRRFNFSSKLRIRIIISLAILVLALAIVFTDSFLSRPISNESTLPISHTTSLFPSNRSVHVNDNGTTGIIVDISGDTLSNSSYFTVTTTNSGLQSPQNASPLTVGNLIVVGYFDVKVTTNMTLTPQIQVKITITNSNFNQNSAIYYWYSTARNWISAATGFQSPHTIIGTIEAIYLTGTPIGIGNGNTSTPTPTASSSPETTPTPSPSPTPGQPASDIVTPSPFPTPTATPSPTPTPSPSPTVSPSPSPTMTPTPTPTNSPSDSSLPSQTPSASPIAPPLVTPEYGWGGLLALLACFGALALFKTRNDAKTKEP